jgi:hypothetical protein
MTKLIHKVKVIQQGKYSFSIIIPSDIKKALDLKKGTIAYIEYEEGGNFFKIILKESNKK